TALTCESRRARFSAFWDPTERERPRRCECWPPCSSRRPARPGCWASMCGPVPARSGAGWAPRCRASAVCTGSSPRARTSSTMPHYMEEADQLCDRIAIIDHGRIVALGTPAELKRALRAEQVVRLEINADQDDGSFVEALVRRAKVARQDRVDGRLVVTVHTPSA